MVEVVQLSGIIIVHFLRVSRNHVKSGALPRNKRVYSLGSSQSLFNWAAWEKEYGFFGESRKGEGRCNCSKFGGSG